MKNYKLSDETKTTPWGAILHRIVATTTFTLAIGITINAGDTGGWIEKESNLSDNAWVSGNAEVSGDALVVNLHDYIVFKNNWSSGRYFTWTKSNDKWVVGCFYGTGEELVKKAYEDSEISGKCYESYVNLVESLKELEQTQ